MKKETWKTIGILMAVVITILSILAFYGTIGYVVVHFITKYW